MKNLEHDFWAWMTLVIVAAIIADLITHGSVTVSLAKVFTSFGNSAISAAAGKGTTAISS
jgi:hypothetical protein